RMQTLVPSRVDASEGMVVFGLPHFSDAAVVAQPASAPSADVIFVDGTDTPAPPSQVGDTMDPGKLPCHWRELAQAKCTGRYTLTWDPDGLWKMLGLENEIPDFKCGIFRVLGYRGCRLAMYLDAEDGGAITQDGVDVGVKPLRTGHEVALYNLVKQHAKDH